MSAPGADGADRLGYRGLPKGVRALVAARAVNAFGAFVFPLLAMYLTKGLGLAGAVAARYVAAAAIGEALGAIVGGSLADRLPRRALLVGCMGASAVAMGACGVAPLAAWTPPLLVAARALQAAADPSLSALLADLTDEGQRKAAFALSYVGVNVGFAFGPVVAGLLFQRSLRALFLGDALTTILAACVIRAWVPSAAVRPATARERPEQGGFFASLARRPRLVAFALCGVLYSTVYTQHAFALPLFVGELFGDGGPATFGLLMSANGVAAALLTGPLAALVRGKRALECVALAGVCYAIGFGGLAWVDGLAGLIVSTLIWTMGEILQSTFQGPYLAANTPSSHRGRYFAALPVVMRSGHFVGPVVAAALVEGTSVRALWLPVGGVALLGAFSMGALARLDAEAERAPVEDAA